MKETILIVDDEKLARERIRSFLGDGDFLPLEAANGPEALDILKDKKVDILFLDIQMPELSGLELLAQIEDRPFQVIFQTAFDEYAIAAFEANACDYLLKPFSRERFHAALERARNRIRDAAALEKVEADLRRRNGFLAKICAKVGAKSVLIPADDIIAFVSQDHYTTVITAAKEFVIELSLNHLEERLEPEKFQRLHRNNIVATSRIRAVHHGDNMEVELEGGRRLPVSRNNRQKVRQPG